MSDIEYPDNLADFVRESNAIEGIHEGPGHPLYDDHLRAARHVVFEATLRRVPQLRAIHRDLLENADPGAQPGRWRSTWVGVGGRICPNPTEVPWLAGQLELRAADRYYAHLHEEAPRLAEGQIWALHHELEYVHPFRDGNGRTGRLWLNGLRLLYGYPWLVVPEEARASYYAEIRAWLAERNLA